MMIRMMIMIGSVIMRMMVRFVLRQLVGGCEVTVSDDIIHSDDDDDDDDDD